jgi:hypothetical protein
MGGCTEALYHRSSGGGSGGTATDYFFVAPSWARWSALSLILSLVGWAVCGVEEDAAEAED